MSNLTMTVNASNWMSGVEDDTPLHQMSIPGSHDSCARHGLGKSQCQSLSITEQLEHGVRFLDIRCVNADVTAHDDFPIFHGIVAQEINFRDVQKECVAFLKRHPSELILMNVQQEKNGGLINKPASEFEGKFLRIIDRGHWSFPNWIPKLREFRSQILLIRPCDPTTNSGWTGANLPGGSGLEWNGFHIDGTSQNQFFQTQNGWERWTSKDWKQNIQDKAVAVVRHIQNAADGLQGPNQIYLNYLSQAAGAYLGTSASEVNMDVLAFLKTKMTDTHKRLGILALDFVGNTGKEGGMEDMTIRHNRFRANCTYKY